MICEVCQDEAEQLTAHYLPTERKTLRLCATCIGREMLELLGLLYIQEYRTKYRPHMETQ